MKKVKVFISGLALLTMLLFLGSTSHSVHASGWHNGLPKMICGNWYLYRHHKPVSHLYGSKHLYAYDDVWYTKLYHAYFNTFSYNFLEKPTYRYVGNHKYIINGLVEGGHSDFRYIGKRRSHVVKVTKNHLREYGNTWTRKKPSRMVSPKKGYQLPPS
ncbi:hypothetical protein OQI89_03560 [Lentilactobacillus diolivorans]|uniref:hypothetical protein n=1 Tax=Lentilactobacillus diolivorans TaxID=179838 RepID=UPI002469800D|nr:hypothetical protein [Lentilactobacillus diolivorans]MDH5104925.1 hypothetical protein [Lentilactobacillus diolivorans]